MNTLTIQPKDRFAHFNILALITLLLVSCVLYIPMVNNYYFADELDSIIASQKLQQELRTGESTILKVFDLDYLELPERCTTHFRPLIYLSSFVVYSIFGPEPVFLNIAIVAGHILVVFLVYLLLSLLLKNNVWAFLTTLFFTIDGVASDAIFYIAAGLNYLPEAIPHILCLITFLQYIRKRKKHFLYLSWGLGLIAFLANEFAFTLVPILIFMNLYYGDAKKWRIIFNWRLYPYYIYAAAIFLISHVVFWNRSEAFHRHEMRFMDEQFVQSRYIRIFQEAGEFLQSIPVLNKFLSYIPSVVIGLLFSLLFIGIILFFWSKIKDGRFRFLILWFISSLLIFIPTPLFARFFYHSVIPMWAIMIYIGFYLYSRLENKFKPRLTMLRMGGMTVLILMIAIQAFMNRKREIMWEGIGNFYLKRIYLIEKNIDAENLKKMTFVRDAGFPQRRFNAEVQSLMSHLKVYFDDPYIELEIIDAESASGIIDTSDGNYVFTLAGEQFIPYKHHEIQFPR